MRKKAGNRHAGTALRLAATAAIVAATSFLDIAAEERPHAKEQPVNQQAYVYTELQLSVPFASVPWARLNGTIKAQPGFINKTWLAGLGNNSAGGFYTFDSTANAEKFVTDYFPTEARAFGAAQTTRIFAAAASETASRDMNSVHHGGKLTRKPGAFVYTEVQLHAVPFDQMAPWRELNPILKQQPGLLSKTWLSGLHTGTPGGLYAFDSVENARKFALDYFPSEAAKLHAAFYTRVFDAAPTEAASREMNSPYYP